MQKIRKKKRLIVHTVMKLMLSKKRSPAKPELSRFHNENEHLGENLSDAAALFYRLVHPVKNV